MGLSKNVKSCFFFVFLNFFYFYCWILSTKINCRKDVVNTAIKCCMKEEVCHFQTRQVSTSVFIASNIFVAMKPSHAVPYVYFAHPSLSLTQPSYLTWTPLSVYIIFYSWMCNARWFRRFYWNIGEKCVFSALFTVSPLSHVQPTCWSWSLAYVLMNDTNVSLFSIKVIVWQKLYILQDPFTWKTPAKRSMINGME